jgi:hypothetical protein
MTSIHDRVPDRLLPTSPAARLARRARHERRMESSLKLQGTERTDRRGPLVEVLRAYRHLDTAGVSGPLGPYVEQVRAEVEALETRTRRRGRRAHQRPIAIRRALALLREFGHLSTLHFGDLPDVDRPLLVELLQLEYRWCFAAAGTTADAFKRAIGRTGAR